MSQRSIVPQLLTRTSASSPRRTTSRRRRWATSLAPLPAQWAAVQIRTCFLVQYTAFLRGGRGGFAGGRGARRILGLSPSSPSAPLVPLSVLVLDAEAAARVGP